MAGDEDDYVPEDQARGEANGAAPEALEQLRTENAELKDRVLRALADAENTRRRAEREREEGRLYAITSFARDILGVADNFQRALDSLPAEARAGLPAQIEAVIEGIEATERQLLGLLERHGVRKIDAAGVKFDPHLHQAIAEVPADGRAPGTVVSVVQTGYVIADRLLRPAMVTVAARGSSAVESPAGRTES